MQTDLFAGTAKPQLEKAKAEPNLVQTQAEAWKVF
jgi:hypothetical protein